MRVLSLILVIASCTAFSDSRLKLNLKDPKGVDNWSTGDILNFFEKECRVSVPLEQVSKLTAQDLFDGVLFDDAVLADLGITGVIEQARVKAKLTKLDEKATASPVDFWEWRAANRRLCDWWVQPLMSAPRVLLIWLRFYQEEGALGKYDAEIDDTNIVTFWLQWVFCPNWPLFKTAGMFHDSGWIDTVLYFTTLVNLIGDLALCFTGKQFTANLKAKMLLEVGLYQFANIGYYVFYWFCPYFVLTFFFYINLYVIAPLIVVGTLFLSVAAIFGLGAMAGMAAKNA